MGNINLYLFIILSRYLKKCFLQISRKRNFITKTDKSNSGNLTYLFIFILSVKYYLSDRKDVNIIEMDKTFCLVVSRIL